MLIALGAKKHMNVCINGELIISPHRYENFSMLGIPEPTTSEPGGNRPHPPTEGSLKMSGTFGFGWQNTVTEARTLLEI
jgi:hypothetical protein